MDAAVATGYDPRSTTNPPSPAPWRPRSRSASPLGNGPARKSAASAQALATQGNAPR